MDIRTTGGPATAEETAAVDALLGPEAGAPERFARGGHEARARRPLLLPVLHALQDRVGWISRGGLDYAARRLDVPPAEAYGVASFYGRFALEERSPRTVHVCDDVACALAGADRLLAQHPGALPSPCLGLCDQAPAALIETAGIRPESVQVGTPERRPAAVFGERRLLARVGRVDPESLDAYLAAGGFEALRRARELGAERVVAAVSEAGLIGRGGAGFPTARKWEAVAKAPAPRYVVCNADESETGTFKDRVLLEEDPFAVIEAMAIAGLATGSEKGYLYLRGEYPLAHRRIENALAQAAGLLDGFQIEIFRGAWAYICGEETALFNSIEGRRGEPRNKPPFPVERGLFGRPTAVNNVETLVNVLDLRPEAEATRLFCVSGHVSAPGVYELRLGTPLRNLLASAGASDVQAVLLGGAAGTFVGPEQLDMPLSTEGARAAGASLGSGAVVVFDKGADLGAVVLRIARFFRHESCGQCVPCRVGTVRQEEILGRLLDGSGERDREVRLLNDVARAMRDASICGLGQTAANAIQSALPMLPR